MALPLCVIDTNVLQKANAAVTADPISRRKFSRRLSLLKDIANGQYGVLISKQLLTEYGTHVQVPRNEFVKAFLEILSTPGSAKYNWRSPWTGDADRARRCRYPHHDDHVLRTAIGEASSTIFTEEHQMLTTDRCIYRSFRVHIRDVD